jgi:hypothetical protein
MKYLRKYNEASIVGGFNSDFSSGETIDLDYIKSVFVDFYEDVNYEIRCVKANNKVDITIKPWNPSSSMAKDMKFSEMSERFSKLSDVMMDIEVCVKRILDEYKGLKYESMLSCNNDIYIKLYYSDLYDADLSNLVKEDKSNDDIVLDVKDILAELKDDGYYADVNMNPNGISMFSVEIFRNENLFNWSDVEDRFDIVKNYVEENSKWDLTKIFVSYHEVTTLFGKKHHDLTKLKKKYFPGKSYDKFKSFINNPNFIDKNMIYELTLIFDI